MRPRLLSLLSCVVLVPTIMGSGVLAQTEADTDSRIDAVLGDHLAFRDAFDGLQAAIAENDAEAFADYLPIGEPVNIDGEAIIFDDPEAFLVRYEEIVTPEIASAIADQSWATLFVNQSGVMFGNGEVWPGAACRDEDCVTFDVQIIAIQSPAD